jgi:hypothetical protein
VKNVMIRFGVAIVGSLALAAAAMAADKAPETPNDPGAMCAEMMKGTGPDGQKAMREFMQLDRAPLAMGKMMDIARQMGDGDPMLGMTRMMDMMGGGMMSPGTRAPGK